MSSQEPTIEEMYAELERIDRQIPAFGAIATKDNMNAESKARAATMILGLQSLREFYLRKIDESEGFCRPL